MIQLALKQQERVNMFNKSIYADCSATTKPRPEVIEAMMKILKDDFGNPSSLHRFGRAAKNHLNEARENISSAISANEEQIIFTSGGTESDNLVIFGVSRLIKELSDKEKHIITTKIEHSAIKEPLEYLEKNGWKVSWLNVDNEGFINLDELKRTITAKTLLVSIIHANNEIGTIQNLKKISEVCKEKNVLFHTDAVQSFCKIPIDVKELGADFMSMSSHKIYGPKGVGALYVKDLQNLKPILIGGSQEAKLRPGTENISGVVGFGVAAKLLQKEMSDNAKHLRELQILLMERLLKTNNVILTGVGLDKVQENIPNERYFYRIPGHVSLCVKDVEGESLVLQMDLKGIAVSSGSACKEKNKNALIKPSHVLEAINIPQEYIKGSLRITLGRENTKEDIDFITQALEATVQNLNKGKEKIPI